MRTVEIGASGVRSSVIGLGALHFGVFLDDAESKFLIDHAIDHGIRFIDTAPLYGDGNSDRIVGDAIREKRSSVRISTKIGLKAVERTDGSFGVEIDHLTPDTVRRGVEANLRALGTNYIDLISLHAYDEHTPIADALGELERMREEGKVLAIGASNYSPEELKSAIAASSEMNRPGLSACQVHYNMIERRAGESLSQICTEKGISLVCNRALARGILTGKYVSGRPFPPSSRAALSDRVRRWATDSTVSMVEGLQRVAQRIGATTTAMSLAWLVQQSAVGVVLVGTRNIAQLNDCLVAGDMVLDADTNDAIEQVIGSHGMTDQVNRLPEEYFER